MHLSINTATNFVSRRCAKYEVFPRVAIMSGEIVLSAIEPTVNKN
ncbi:hypothetical protein J18TS1_45190 [Oceanobacillus oncorhynchi subsp. incaldanensis]|nr:hypothetical protein J18TS1_45190 [Oceanobacillus oncorhynchi subsp. incaldanensis]